MSHWDLPRGTSQDRGTESRDGAIWVVGLEGGRMRVVDVEVGGKKPGRPGTETPGRGPCVYGPRTPSDREE